MATIHEILSHATDRLVSVSDTPRLDAEYLLCKTLDCTRTQLISMRDEEVSASDLEELVRRRLNHEPVAYIVEQWEFFSCPIIVRPPTLVPRPETEHLVEWILELLPGENTIALEIGAGTGCIPIAVTRNHSNVFFTSVDIKSDNLKLAQENATLNGVGERIEFVESDLFQNIKERDPFDLICSNPPYVPDDDWPGLAKDIRHFEDRDALLSGNDGLDLIRRIVTESFAQLKSGGPLLLEIGAGQEGVVAGLLEENGYTDVGFHKDLAGFDRIAMGRKPR